MSIAFVFLAKMPKSNVKKDWDKKKWNRKMND